LGTAFFLRGETPNPYICFYIMTFFGFCVGISGLFIDKSLEANQAEMVKMNFKERTKFVFGEVK